MKSACIDAFSDDPGAVEVREVPVPRPAAGQLRVRMRMAPVNPSDFNYMDGIYERSFARMIWNREADQPTDSPGSEELFPRPPYALGVEGVGVVEESGGGFLGRRLVGKRVAVVSGPPNGTWQEQTLIDARRAFPVPRSLSDAQACSFFVNPLTALVLVRHLLQVPRGSVLQTAAGSALSQMVRNLAREDGFRVIDVVRSRSGAERLKRGNAKYVVALEDEELLDAVHRIAPGGVDYVLDCVGGPTGSEALRALSPGGRMVCYGTLSREPISLPPRDIMMPMTSVEGFYLAGYLAKRTLLQRFGLVRKTAKLIESGVLGTPVEQTYRLDALQEALEHARRPGRAGKILLDLS